MSKNGRTHIDARDVTAHAPEIAFERKPMTNLQHPHFAEKKPAPAPVAGILRAILPALLLALLTPLLLTGCATISGRPEPPDIEEARYDDAGIKTSITSQLLKNNAAKANDVNVHCFNGHVFLIGEADPDFRAEALDVAEEAEGVVHVTTHWFATGTASTANDAAIEREIDKSLMFTEDISTRRVAVDIWGGHVVLTGIMEKQEEIDRAVSKIKQIDQVKSVTSYLVIG